MLSVAVKENGKKEMFYYAVICAQIYIYRVQCTSKKQSREKMLYFSNVSTDLSQTLRLCMRVFTQHIWQIY